ncbi:hypothetical protein LY76DRAFT_345198 [Colletotrichum caudatum]|nr:hypothetical protein LY76DRAFT_345198 [Colletotrichum caudatum]
MQCASAKATFGRGRHRGVTGAPRSRSADAPRSSLYRVVQACAGRCQQSSFHPLGRVRLVLASLSPSSSQLAQRGEGETKEGRKKERKKEREGGDDSDGIRYRLQHRLFPKSPPPPPRAVSCCPISCQSPSSWGERIGSGPKGLCPGRSTHIGSAGPGLASPFRVCASVGLCARACVRARVFCLFVPFIER